MSAPRGLVLRVPKVGRKRRDAAGGGGAKAPAPGPIPAAPAAAPLEGTGKGWPRKVWLTPPEGTPIAFSIAPYGSRVGAQLIDLALPNMALGVLFLLVTLSEVFTWQTAATLFILLSFLARTPYYILSELLWNGATPGKRMVGIRVISADGRRLTPQRIVARNLLKEAEVFLPVGLVFAGASLSDGADALLALWMLGTVCVPLFNRRRRRLGDMIGGTIVVNRPDAALRPDLAVKGPDKGAWPGAPKPPGFVFDPAQLSIYGRRELQALERILRNPPQNDQQRAEVLRVARTIEGKIGYPEPVTEPRAWAFLTDFYAAQREHLESRRLFGEDRADKFHGRGQDGGGG
ncbi:RDD family protein [Rhodovulum sp. DZ06]|uniref:RDD family protein n=1 Tax=Rhodovulum sp. DZ06 TaxID=3425126 RepID=UPI003D325E02